jgi:hypothetical protein
MIRIAACFRNACLLSMTLVFASAVCAVHAQQQTTASPLHQPGAAADGSGFGGANPTPRDPEQARMMKEMSRDRNALRQKEIVTDTDQLSDLVKQLKDAVDKSSKDQLSLSVVNTANEIEKLAKSIKEKMRDGQ